MKRIFSIAGSCVVDSKAVLMEVGGKYILFANVLAFPISLSEAIRKAL